MDLQVQANDILLQVYERGNLNSQNILIFLHGGPGSGAKALMELSAFTKLEQDYLCIYFDQRGSGNSLYDLRNGLSIKQLQEDVQAVIDHTILRHPHKCIILWGGSFGGVLACLYMERYGNHDVDALILSSPAICFDRKQSLALFDRTSTSMMKRLSSQAEQKQMDSTLTPEEILTQPEFQSFVFSNQNPSTSLRHIVAMTPWFFHYNATSCFQKLSLPTLLMIGEDDPICDAFELLTSLSTMQLPFLQQKSFKQCAHAVFEDCEDLFVQTIQEFIQCLEM